MQTIKMDFQSQSTPPVVPVMQSDAQSRFIGITLYNGGVPYESPEGASYTVQYRGPGPNNMGWYDTITLSSGTRKAVTVDSTNKNIITLELAEQALRVNGNVFINLCVVTSTGYMLHTFPILCRVTGAAYVDPVAVRSFFYVTGITSEQWLAYVTACQDAQNRAEAAAATFQTDPTLSVSGKAADAAKVGEAVNAETERAKGVESQIKEDLTDVESALVLVKSSNYWNPDEVTSVTVDDTSLLQSGKVSVSEGEVYYLSEHANNSDSLTADPFWAVYQYDSNGNKTMSKNWLSSYTVPSGVVAVQFLDASTTYKYIMVEKDTQTLKWEDYFDPYYKCVDKEARTDIDEMKKAIEGVTDNSEFIIPSAFYGVANHEMNIYYQNICKNVSIDSVCGFDTASVSGVERYRDRLIWKPTAKSIENGKISFYKNDWNHETKNITVPFISAPSDTGSTEIKVLVIGDSKISYGEVVRYLSSLFDSDNHTLTLLGSRYDNNDTGDTKYKHEGRSGWSSYHYTYVQSYNDVANAFYNSNYTDPSYGTKFDFSTYMSNQGYNDVDYVFINLGTNDYSQGLSDIKWQTDAMIKSIHAFNSSIKIVIGLNEGVYRRALQHTALNEWIYTLNATKIAKYDGKLSNVYVLPIYPSIDLYNDYQMSSVALSEGDSVYGDSKTRTYVSDPIHQNKAGFYKYAMCMYSLIKCIEGGLVS